MGNEEVTTPITPEIENRKSSLTDNIRLKTNEDILNHLMTLLKSNQIGFSDMKKKIYFTYNVTILLYIVLFVLGILLLSVPLYYAYFKGNIAVYNSPSLAEV